MPLSTDNCLRHYSRAICIPASGTIPSKITGPATPLWNSSIPSALNQWICSAAFLQHRQCAVHYDPQNYDRKAPIILLVSAGMLCCLYYFYKIIWKYYVHDETGTATNAKPQPTIGRRASGHTASTRSATGLGQRLREYFLSPLEPIPFPRRENPFNENPGSLPVGWQWVFVYSLFALYDLGESGKAPTTTYEICREN